MTLLARQRRDRRIPAASASGYQRLNRLPDPAQPQAAERLPDAIEQTVQLIIAMPGIGERVYLRSQAVDGLRKTPLKRFKRHVVYYIAGEERVVIVRILHSARDRDIIIEDEI